MRGTRYVIGIIHHLSCGYLQSAYRNLFRFRAMFNLNFKYSLPGSWDSSIGIAWDGCYLKQVDSHLMGIHLFSCRCGRK